MTNAKKYAGTTSVLAMLIGPSIPGGYMAITGHAPTWARIWYLAWLVIGLLAIVAKAGRSES